MSHDEKKKSKQMLHAPVVTLIIVFRNIYQIFRTNFSQITLLKYMLIINQYVASNYLLINSLIKGTLSGLRQFLTIESPLKMMKNPFDFTLKALSVLKMFNFLS